MRSLPTTQIISISDAITLAEDNNLIENKLSPTVTVFTNQDGTEIVFMSPTADCFHMKSAQSPLAAVS